MQLFVVPMVIVVVIVLKLIGVNWPGYTSLMASILFLGGVQLIMIGVLGEYIGKILSELKARPIYFIAEHSEKRADARVDEKTGEKTAEAAAERTAAE